MGSQNCQMLIFSLLLRWVSSSQHGLSKSDADILLTLLRKCAWAGSPVSGEKNVNYMKEVDALKASHIWKQNDNVRSWLSSTWLSVPEVRNTHTHTTAPHIWI